MSHKTFKVCILIDNLVENFYIKHYIDEFQPVFSRFKVQVFQRNPTVNVQHLKIYWIDGENDEILIACEEDFRLFLEEGKGRKIFFSVNNSGQYEAVSGSQPMDAEDTPQASKCERKSRKGRDEERERRQTKKLAEKLKYLEENCLKKEEKGRRFLEKREYKHVEKLEKAKRRVEQIRNLIGSIDPANLNSSNNSHKQETEFNVGASTSSENNNAVHPSPETIRLLSNAIAGCLQPCSLINKILNEVIGMIPQMVDTVAPPPYTETQNSDISMEQRSQATNTSNVSTPKVQQASNEIEALFKEAAKELEKMNEIVNSSKATEMSASSSSATTGITQIERVFMNINDSAISNATVVNMDEQEPLINTQIDEIDNVVSKSMMEDQFVTPSKSMRSRDSSIEVHDINSVMSDDSRDWTILDQEDISVEQSPRLNNPFSGAIPKKSSVDNFAQVDFTAEKLSIETQTPALTLQDNSKQHELQASVQKSIEIVQKSIENIQKSMESAASVEPEKVEPVKIATPQSSIAIETEILQPTPYSSIIYPQLPNPEIVFAPLPTAPSRSQANVRAAGRPIKIEKKPPTFAPAVVVYDPNPKINSSIHKMMAMGFTNEDNWLTQLMVSVDGDIAKAADFLTPQKKNIKKD